METAVLERPNQAVSATTARYAKVIEVSKRIRWDIDLDVIRGRKFDFGKKFMPDGLSKIESLVCFVNERVDLVVYGVAQGAVGSSTEPLAVSGPATKAFVPAGYRNVRPAPATT
jgi:hypothetical protein